MRQYLSWKAYLAIVALGIVAATLLYTNQLAGKLALEERKDIEHFAEGLKTLATAPESTAEIQDVSFALSFVKQNTTIPVIIADEQENIADYNNIDTSNVRDVPKYLRKKLEEFKKQHPPIVSDYGFGKNYIYFGESYLLTQLRYFPYVQLAIIFLFLVIVLAALRAAYRSMQNQVWVGLSKETAHQLGTPLSSMEGWLELLGENEESREAADEMKKDLGRLKLVADRFSKVGSAPQLQEENLVERLQFMVEYMQKRAPSKISITLSTTENEIPVLISAPLFDWVIENLMRNALDAMDGKGSIEIKVVDNVHQVWVDVCDTGKGIPRHLVKKVFNPGFTTKKRGWGLGLSLARRIVEQYHSGTLYVKQSEPGKGTTFRIVLKR